MKAIVAHEVPTGSRIQTECSDGSTYLTLGRLDGCYHNSRTEKGAYCMVSICELLVKVSDGVYRLATEDESKEYYEERDGGNTR